jgi:hypothetical protein
MIPINRTGKNNIKQPTEVDPSKEFFNEVKASTNTAVFADKLAQGIETYNGAFQARAETLVDEKNNPIYENLPNDIERIGQEIRDEIGAGIDDPAASAQFVSEFNDYIAQQKIEAFSLARDQHIAHVRAGTGASLSKFQDLAANASSEDASDFYIGQVQNIVASAVASGAYTQQEGTAIVDNFIATTNEAKFRRFIEQDPKAAKAQIQEEGTDVLTEKQVENLITEAEAKEVDLELRQQKQEAEAERQIIEQQSATLLDMRTRLRQDELGLTEIEQRKEELGDKNYRSIRSSFFARQRKLENELVRMSEISAAVENGERLSGFTRNDIDKHYQLASKNFKEGQATLAEKAILAAKYKAPVRTFQAELEGSILSGGSEQALDAIHSYNFMLATSPEALENLDKKSRAVLETAKMFSQNTGLPASEAIELARTRVLDANDEVRKIRGREFRKIKEFKDPVELESLIVEVFDAEEGITGFVKDVFTFDENVALGVRERVRTALDEAYRQTGDAASAKAIVQSQMKGTIGETQFNGGGHVMLFPPEKMFPQADSDELQTDLNVLLKDFDLSTEQVFIQSDEFTRGLLDKAGNELVSYGLYTRDEQGREKPLLDPNTGEILRWQPGIDEIVKGRVAKSLAEAEGRRKRALELQEAPEQRAVRIP